MIALLDREKRGYVTMEEFMDFFEKGLYDIPPALDE